MGEAINTSGMGEDHPLPEGVAGWSWGAFVFSWIWAIGNRTWPGLLGVIPGIGLIVRAALGMHGRRWAWQNQRWDSLAHFQRVQRRWNIAAGVLVLVVLIAALALVALATHAQRAAQGAGRAVGGQLEL